MPSPTQAVAAASSDQPHPPTCQTLLCSGCKRGTIPVQMETSGSYGRGATCWKSRNNPVNLLRYQTSLMLETSFIVGAVRAIGVAKDPVRRALHCVGFYNMQPIHAYGWL